MALGLILLLGVLVPAARASLPDSGERWFQVETEHFRVLSNASKRRAESTARELEALHGLLDRIAAEPRLGPKTQVYALRTSDDFQAYSPWPDRRSVAGFFTTGILRNYIVLDLGSRGASRAIYHEYLHEFASNNFPGVPLWFNEGLAEYYSTFEVGAHDAQVGRPIEQHVLWLVNNRPIPLAELFAVDTDSEEYHEGRRAGMFYAQSWATVHYLLSDNERIGQVATFLTALQQGAEIERAFEQGFGTTFSQLEEEVDLYVRRGEFSFLRTPLDWLAESRLETSTPRRSELLTRLGELLAVQETRINDAAEHFSAALRESDGQAALARAGLGRIEWQRGDRDGALEQLRQATRDSPAAEPRLYLGLLLLDELLRSADPTKPRNAPSGNGLAHEAQQALQEALQAEPNWPRALVGLGLTYLFAGDPKKGIEVMNRALQLRPSDPLVGFGLAGLAARADAFQVAWERTEQLAELIARTPARNGGTNDSLHAAARDMVATLQVNRAISLYNEDSWQAAMELVDDLSHRLDALEYRRFQTTIEGLQAANEDRAAAALYNQAVGLANDGDLEAALALIERVLALSTLDPGLRSQASDAAANLRSALEAPQQQDGA